MQGHAESHVQGFDILAIDQHLVREIGALLATFEIDDTHLKCRVEVFLVLGGHANGPSPFDQKVCPASCSKVPKEAMQRTRGAAAYRIRRAAAGVLEENGT